jgi:hypothetical protein
MQSTAATLDDYINSLPDDRKKAMQQLRNVTLENLPAGFEEAISYGMLGYVVPHSLYPSGYHCDPKLPLPFLGIASQKTLSLFITWVYMQIQSSMNGLYLNTQSILN